MLTYWHPPGDNKMSFRILATAALVLVTSARAFAFNPITYVDADSLGPILNEGDPTNRTTGNTTQLFNVGFDDWVVRDNGVGGDVYQFMGSNGADPTELATTISGLTPGTEYNFYAFFWEAAAGTSGWYVDASLGGPGAPDTEFTHYAVASLNNLTGPVFEAAELPIANLSAVNTTSEYLVSNPGAFYTVGLTPGFGNDQTRSDDGPTDLDLLAANIGSMTVSASGQVEVYIRNLSAGNRVWFDGVGYQEAGGVSGDTNGDGQVNLADYNEIASRIGGPSVTPGSIGDVFGDGIIDLRDFSLWQRNRTDLGAAPAAASVPEPSTLLLAGVAAMVAYARRRLDR
jgi:hypothetical protein